MDVLQACSLIERGDALVIPACWLDATKVRAHLPRHVALREVLAKVDGYTFRAYKLRLPKKTYTAIFMAILSGLSFRDLGTEIDVAAVDDPDSKHVVAILPANVKVEMRLSDNYKGEEANAAALAKTAYTPILRRLAQVSGYDVIFDAKSRMNGEYGEVVPANTLHIYTNSKPPGEKNSVSRIQLFGLPIKDAAWYVACRNPVPGRGLVCQDTENQPVIQMLGNTWYLLFPAISFYHAPDSQDILDRVLTMALETHQQDRPRKAETCSLQDLVKLARNWDAEALEISRKGLKEADDHIERAQKQLSTAIRTRIFRLEQIARIEAAIAHRQDDQQNKKMFATLFANSLIENIKIHDGAVHVRTRHIEALHGERSYDLGIFTIQVDPYHGDVAVWCELSTHPDGVPHPHISPDGTVCYGNASRAIATAAGEQRVVDVIEYTLRWLVQGYTPELALYKIEDWPIVGETKEQRDQRNEQTIIDFIDVSITELLPPGRDLRSQ